MENVIFEIMDQIGVIRLNRSKAMNALNVQVIHELSTVLEEIRKNPEIRVLIIGNNEHFAAGADINAMVECNEEEAKGFVFTSVFREIELLNIPSIAAINGYALGGGLELAMSCDLRIASPKAKLGLPEINLGIMPGAGGTIRTPKLVGLAKAKELIFMGEIIDASSAERIGLINKVSEQDDAMELAMEWAKKLCMKAPIALKTAKDSIIKGAEASAPDAAYSLEKELWASLFRTQDQKEGMRAFLEKRQPDYKGN